MNSPHNLGHQERSFWECFLYAQQGCTSAVELGCGHGNNLRQLQARRKVGVEVVAEYPVRIHDEVEFIIMDVLEWARKAASRSFDLVLIIDVIEHFTKEDGVELLNNAQRIANKRVVLWVPEGELIQNEEVFDTVNSGYKYYPSQDHKSEWYPQELESCGFDVARWENYHIDRNTKEKTIPALFCVWDQIPKGAI